MRFRVIHLESQKFSVDQIDRTVLVSQLMVLLAGEFVMQFNTCLNKLLIKYMEIRAIGRPNLVDADVQGR